jgi:hypothetical protein
MDGLPQPVQAQGALGTTGNMVRDAGLCRGVELAVEIR